MRREIYADEQHRVVTLADDEGLHIIVADEPNSLSRSVRVPWAALDALDAELSLRCIDRLAARS
jgi:hypothetical protein